jgi:endoglucanase
MKRRDFNKVAASTAALGAFNLKAISATNPTISCVGNAVTGGTNLSGMEWTSPGLRYGQSTEPNLNFTVPRQNDIKYLATTGMTKNRLPIQWELLQPMLHDTPASTAVKNAVGQPGVFHALYEAYITSVLDAHAQAGIKCIIDCHNYCRYKDFKYQSDGSVKDLVIPSNPLIRPYTNDNSQVQVRIFSLAAGSTLKQSNFTDFWSRAARKWKDHPGFGGYGLMNEPNNMPTYNGTQPVDSYPPYSDPQDYSISNTFSQAAVNAIRAIDATNPIYVGGNNWSNPGSIASQNPGFPLSGNNIIYEIHMYLDASSSGAYFDYDTEVAKGYSAALNGSINQNTGMDRLKLAVDWAKSKGVKLALTETGMPIDDARWQTMFQIATNYAISEGIEVYSWMGGNHWPIRSYAINHVPGWHQNKTVEPLVSGAIKSSLRKAQANIFDSAECFYSGKPLNITVYARGNLSKPVVITLSSNNGGTFSKTTLTLPAGVNTQDTFTFTPDSNRVSTITYKTGSARPMPAPRKIFSLSNPVLYSATSLTDAALAIMAKYNISKWDMSDSYTDYMLGSPSEESEVVRAVADSGYGSTARNTMEMLNWINKESNMGDMKIPTLKTINGKKSSDYSAENTWGLWCKKSVKNLGIQANPDNKTLYNIEDSYFTLACVSAQNSNGVIFQASQAEENFMAELGMSNNAPTARWVDINNQNVNLVGGVLPANTPTVLAFTCAPGNQTLRVNSQVKSSSKSYFAASQFNQMLIGWGFINYYPRGSFGGNIFGVLTGKGNPSNDELVILEKYLASLGGVTI